MTPTRRSQESFWLPARKLKPRRVTMLLLAVEKECFMGLSFLFLFKFMLSAIAPARRMSRHSGSG